MKQMVHGPAFINQHFIRIISSIAKKKQNLILVYSTQVKILHLTITAFYITSPH
jgi:hypothetical protein